MERGNVSTISRWTMCFCCFGILQFVASTPSWAAGFDCVKDATKVEKMTCQDAGLSRLDDDLARAYKSALISATDKETLKKNQILLLAGVDEGSIGVQETTSTQGVAQEKEASASYTFLEFPSEWKKYDTHPWGMLAFSEFKKVYYSAIKGNHPKWVKKLGGPAEKNRVVKSDIGMFVFIRTCEPHECGENYLTMLYSPSNAHIFGMLRENGVTSWIGDPDDRLKKLLIILVSK